MRTRSGRAALASSAAALAMCLTPGVLAAAPGDEVERAAANAPFDSEFLAGYLGAGGDGGIQATFTVPSFTCAPSEYSGTFPSVTSYYEPGADRFQNGGGGVAATCTDGERDYTPVLLGPDYEWIEVDRPVAPGDKIKVTFTSTRPSSTSTITNLTQGWSASDSSPYLPTVAGQVGDAFLVVGGSQAPPPDFGRNTFSKVRLDGRRLARDRWSQVDLVDGAGDTILDTSRLRKGTFTVRHV